MMENLAQFESQPDRYVAANESQRQAICEYLVESGKIESANAERALRLQAEQSQWEKIGQILVKLGLTSETDLAECLARQLEMKLVFEQDFPPAPLSENTVSEQFLKANKILILDETDDDLTLAMADPEDQFACDALRLCCRKNVVACLGIPSEIEHALNRFYDDSRDTSNFPGSADTSIQFLDDVEQLKELAGEAPIIKLVNQLISKAAESGASDIHIEPFDAQLKVRYRIDGLLREMDAPTVRSAAAVISRVKIMANLNIAERRLSQDGRFRQRVRGNEFDVRVSTVPTMHGESVVMRLLQRDNVLLNFGPLGFSVEQEQAMLDILAMPHGILLVTGPTGSGKTTTLYAALRHLNQPQRMIITVEDPVEYDIHGINQMQVKPQIGLTFASALRSIVRQDPDVIMIGEMRDGETAEIAVQSALTGHLVLSTLHTNDAAGSVMRLLDIGVQDYLLTSAVNAIHAQRLVRTLCTQCREPYEPVDEIKERFGLQRFTDDNPVTLHRAAGCASCGDTGYAGRSAILEMLLMSDAIKALVLKRCDVGEIARAAADQGMTSMRDDGLNKAVAGVTSLEEVLRVTPEPGQ